MIRKNTGLIACSLLAAFMFAGCDIDVNAKIDGGITVPIDDFVKEEDIDEQRNGETDIKENNGENIDNNENEGNTENNDNAENDGNVDNNDQSGNDNNSGIDTQINVNDDDPNDIRIYDAAEEYKLFLNGEKKCKIAEHERGWDIEFGETEEYSLSDIVEFAEDSNIYEEKKIDTISYAFIDCGLDGKKELALCLDSEEAQSSTDYFIFTLKDGEIYLVNYEYSYYVYFTDISDTGFITINGRDNAVTHFWQYGYVNADGEYIYDYILREQAALPEPFIPDVFLPNDYEGYVEEDFDANGQYFADVYNFTTFTYDDDDVSTFEDCYNEYKRHNMTTFFDYDGNNVEPSDEMKKFYDENNIDYYTESGIEELIEKHEEEIGLTDEIKNGSPIEWTVLE